MNEISIPAFIEMLKAVPPPVSDSNSDSNKDYQNVFLRSCYDTSIQYIIGKLNDDSWFEDDYDNVREAEEATQIALSNLGQHDHE